MYQEFADLPSDDMYANQPLPVGRVMANLGRTPMLFRDRRVEPRPVDAPQLTD